MKDGPLVGVGLLGIFGYFHTSGLGGPGVAVGIALSAFGAFDGLRLLGVESLERSVMGGPLFGVGLLDIFGHFHISGLGELKL